MIDSARAAAAFVVGLAIGLLPPFAADRTGADWMASAYARWHPARPETDVMLVLIDRQSLAHPAFAARPRAEWGEPVAQLMEILLDAGAQVLALDVVLPRGDPPTLLAAIRRSARDGRLVLGMVAGAAGAAPSRAQLAAAGGTGALATVNLETDASGLVRALSPVNGGLPVIGAALASRAGAPINGVARVVRGTVPALTAWSARDVLDCASPSRLAEAFAGRAVLIGAWLPHEDRHPSALGRLPRASRTVSTAHCSGPAPSLTFYSDAPGVLLHALSADRWLHRDALVRLSRSAELAMVTAAALVGACVQRLRRRGLLVALALVSWATLAVGLADALMLPWLAVAVALVTAAAVSELLRVVWHAARLAATVPPAFRATPDATTTRTITACFIDIESFTSATESIADPARVATELAACLQRLARIIERHHGFVDKYLGDGVFALFGVDDGDGRAEAVAATTACLAECTEGRLCLGGRPLGLRVGLAAGPARVGTLHGGQRLHFTAIGDPVNVAARLEQLNRALGTRVLADADVAAGVKNRVWRDLGWHALRGRRASVRVYELTCPATPL